MLQPDLANQVEVLPFIDMGVQLRSCGPFLLCVTKGTWRQDDTIKPQARRLGGVRTQPRAGLREKPPKRGRPRVGAPPSPHPPTAGPGARSARSGGAFLPVPFAAARARPCGRAQQLCGLRVSPSSRRPCGWHGNRATCSRAARPPARSAHAAATAGAGAGAAPMMHRASPVPSGPPCCRSER